MYEVTSMDICCQGFERLRNQSEFLLVAYPDAKATPDSLMAEWLSDIQACARPDAFDYDAAESAVRTYVDGSRDAISRALASLEWPEPNDDSEPDEGESVCAFLFVDCGDAATAG